MPPHRHLHSHEPWKETRLFGSGPPRHRFENLHPWTEMRRRSSYTEPDCCFAGVGDVEIQKTKKKILLISLRTLEETAVVEWDIGSGRKYGTNAVLHDWSLPMEFFANKISKKFKRIESNFPRVMNSQHSVRAPVGMKVELNVELNYLQVCVGDQRLGEMIEVAEILRKNRQTLRKNFDVFIAHLHKQAESFECGDVEGGHAKHTLISCFPLYRPNGKRWKNDSYSCRCVTVLNSKNAFKHKKSPKSKGRKSPRTKNRGKKGKQQELEQNTQCSSSIYSVFSIQHLNN